MKWKMVTTIGMVVLFFTISIACGGRTRDIKDAEDWCTRKGGRFEKFQQQDGKWVARCVYCAVSAIDPEHCPGLTFHRNWVDLSGDGKAKRPRATTPQSEREWFCTNENGEVTTCQDTTLEDIRVECTGPEVGGTWHEPANGSPYCSAGDTAAFFPDVDGDGYIQETEPYCEGLDSNGNPNGQEVACPFDELAFE